MIEFSVFSLFFAGTLLVLSSYVVASNKNELIPSKFVLRNSYLSALKTIELRQITFLNETMFMYKKEDGIGDGVDYVLEGWNGEANIANSFQRKLKDCAAYHSNYSTEGGHHHKQHRPLVLDIGANGGVYGMYAAKMGCHSYFFEIQPACIRNIYSSILINNLASHATVVPFPIGNDSNKVITLDESSQCFGVYRLSTGKQHKEFDHNEKKFGSKIDAYIQRIDDLFEHVMLAGTLPPIWLIKIDTEGYEMKVIAGMAKLLKSGLVHEVIVELTPEYWKQYNWTRPQVAQVFCEILWDAGYQNVSYFGNYDKHESDTIVNDRNHLFKLIKSGIRSQKDFHFVKTNR